MTFLVDHFGSDGAQGLVIGFAVGLIFCVGVTIWAYRHVKP